MFKNIVDLLKEVFWIKPSRKKSKAFSRRKTPTKKKTAKKKTKKPTLKVKVPLKSEIKQAASAKGGSASGGKKKVVPKAIKPAKAVVPAIDPALVQVGEITHYFDRIKVCVVKITHGSVLIGDKLTILGPKTKFVQKVWSMQIESVDVKVAKKGQLIGLKVEKTIAVGDKVYK